MCRAAFFGLFSVALLPGCLSPTQVTLELSTDVPCSSQPVTTIGVGDPGKVETSRPQTTTSKCDAKTGSIGSIVVTPGTSNGATFEVQVIVSVGVPASDCSKDKNNFMPKGAAPGTGCIVARREIAFVPHTPLKLPIELDQACLGQKCKEGFTCVVENNVPVCKSQKIPPGCTNVGQTACMTSSATGMGGAGMGGAGMGGMSGSGAGGGTTHCSSTNCDGCSPDKCITIPGTGFSACQEAVDMPACGGLTTCCKDGDCADAGANEHCRRKVVCDVLTMKFTCQQDQWTGAACDAPNTVAVPAGVLGFQVNTCVANHCAGGCKGGQICYPVHDTCCDEVGFACILPDEACCADAVCGSGKGCLIDATRMPALQCDTCPMNISTGAQ